jgi:DNA N-6-adenine-methyltransferase (Dam)
VRIEVPVVLQAVIGKANLTKGLGTGDYDEACRRAKPHIANFEARIAQARKGRYWFHNNVKSRHFNGTDALSSSPEWFTPLPVFTAMGVLFDMDVASPGRQFVDWIPARIHLTKAEDGLTTPWQGFVWCNPPYGLRNGMQKWIDKFVEHGNGVIMLPGYTYTRWFHDLVMKVDCILFPLYKLQFINPTLPPTRRNCTLSNCLAAIGDQGIEALHNASSKGFERMFVIP